MSTPSTPMTSTPAAVAQRPRGWGRLLLGVAAAFGVPVVAQLRLFVPIELTVLFVGPIMAACSLAAWTRGGKVWLLLAWGVLAAWMLTTSVGPGSAFDPLARGWIVCLAAAFGVTALRGDQHPFFPRALAATAITALCALLVLLVSPGGLDDAGRTVADEFARRLQQVSDEYARRSQTTEWQSLMARYPGAASLIQRGEAQLPELARLAISAFPALLALQSLALLALGWALFHRVSRTRIGPSLHLLCEFRFSDQLVWGVVLGVTLMVLPTLRDARGLGLNLLVFFGALYALRGLGVLSWFIAPRRPTPVLLVIAACLAGPVVGVFTLGLGLSDTWLDWRGRARPAS